MSGRPPDGQRMLDEARENCRRVIDEVARDARSLEPKPPRGRPPPVGDDALAEGRAAYDRARAAAEELLRRLGGDASESP